LHINFVVFVGLEMLEKNWKVKRYFQPDIKKKKSTKKNIEHDYVIA